MGIGEDEGMDDEATRCGASYLYMRTTKQRSDKISNAGSDKRSNAGSEQFFSSLESGTNSSDR